MYRLPRLLLPVRECRMVEEFSITNVVTCQIRIQRSYLLDFRLKVHREEEFLRVPKISVFLTSWCLSIAGLKQLEAILHTLTSRNYWNGSARLLRAVILRKYLQFKVRQSLQQHSRNVLLKIFM